MAAEESKGKARARPDPPVRPPRPSGAPSIGGSPLVMYTASEGASLGPQAVRNPQGSPSVNDDDGFRSSRVAPVAGLENYTAQESRVYPVDQGNGGAQPPYPAPLEADDSVLDDVLDELDDSDDGIDVDEHGNLISEPTFAEASREAAAATASSPSPAPGVAAPPNAPQVAGVAGLVGARAVGLARRQVKLASSAVRSRAEEELVRARAAVLERLSSGEEVDAFATPTNADLVASVRGYVKNQVNEKGTALVGAIRQKLDQPGRAVPRKIFETFVALGRYALDVDREAVEEADDTEIEHPADRWLQRSLNYIEVMQPEGRRWLELVLDHSVLDKNADLSFAFEVQLDEEMEHQIDMDLPRTYPDIEYFDDPAVLLSMRRVLRAAAVALPEVGYVQGMNFLVGYLLLHSKTEETALRILIELMANPRYNMRNVFVEGLPSLRKLTEVLQNVVRSRDPELYKHFCDIGFDDLFVVYQWICTLFAGAMPFDALADAWTLFFERGWVGVVAITLTLMMDHRKALMQSDFERSFALLKAAAANPNDGYIDRARQMRFAPTQISEIEHAVLS